MFLDTVLIWLAFYVFTIICLRLSYSGTLRNVGVVLILIVVAQLMLKLYDRYYLPYFSLRAGDETFWLTSLTI